MVGTVDGAPGLTTMPAPMAAAPLGRLEPPVVDAVFLLLLPSTTAVTTAAITTRTTTVATMMRLAPPPPRGLAASILAFRLALLLMRGRPCHRESCRPARRAGPPCCMPCA